MTEKRETGRGIFTSGKSIAGKSNFWKIEYLENQVLENRISGQSSSKRYKFGNINFRKIEEVHNYYVRNRHKQHLGLIFSQHVLNIDKKKSDYIQTQRNSTREEATKIGLTVLFCYFNSKMVRPFCQLGIMS